MQLLGPLLGATAGTDVGGASYVSGTDDCSDFDDADRYTVTSG
jgi:hypothetical protein